MRELSTRTPPPPTACSRGGQAARGWGQGKEKDKVTGTERADRKRVRAAHPEGQKRCKSFLTQLCFSHFKPKNKIK